MVAKYGYCGGELSPLHDESLADTLNPTSFVNAFAARPPPYECRGVTTGVPAPIGQWCMSFDTVAGLQQECICRMWLSAWLQVDHRVSCSI